MMAIQLAPTDETYWARLAFAYKAQNLTDKMTKAAEVAVRLRPESPARELLGLAPASTQPEPGLTGEKPKPASQPDNRDVFFQ
jgi:cytochrome c-type biogenesis protein CcmH/NrfG